MTDGMRRPPRLWEQKLEALVRSSGVGVGSSSAGTSPVVGGPTPGPGGPGESLDPVPVVDLDPSTPRVPATPTVIGAIGGLSIIWTGLDDDGDPYPAGTTVQVHVSASTGFTPDSSTLRGVIGSGERLTVDGLTSGTTYYVVFVQVSPDGVVGEPSVEQSASAGFVLSTNIGTGEISADLVSFDAAAIGGIQQFVGGTTPTTSAAEGSTWINTSNGSYYTLTGGSWVQRQWDSAAIAANAISTTQLAAGAITAGSAIIANAAIGNAQIANVSADKLTAGTIDASVITVSNLNASNITTGTLTGRTISGGTITGATVQSGTGTDRIVITSNGNTISFISSSGTAQVASISSGGSAGIEITGFLDVSTKVDANSLNVVSGFVDFPGCVTNAGGTTGDAGFNGNRLRQKSSTQRLKYDITKVAAGLDNVDPERTSNVATVNPLDILNVGVAEFTWVENGEGTDWRELGFIAEDVHAKFPIAVGYDAEGEPFNVRDTPMVAALLAVVKDQQARIEALEAQLP